jgi:hypothetical protein
VKCFIDFLFDCIDFPGARKFHSIFPFHKNQIIIFGGAFLDQDTGRHAVVSGNLWKFDFEKLEWSMLPSLTMLKPTYFHAAAMNEVKVFLILKSNSFVSYLAR